MTRALLVCLLLSGCAENLVQAKVAVPSLEPVAAPAAISRPSVSAAVQPLGYAELESGKVPKIKASWGEIDRTQAAMAGRNSGTKLRHEELVLIPVPSFAVAIINESAAPIQFKDAQVRLEGKSGKTYKAILKPEDVAARVDVLTREKYPSAAGQEQLMDQLREAVMRVPLLSVDTSLAPGARFDGVLVIDFAAYNLKELDQLLQSEDSYSLVFENLGGESRPLSIRIAINKVAQTISARCPEGKPATAQSCRLGE